MLREIVRIVLTGPADVIEFFMGQMVALGRARGMSDEEILPKLMPLAAVWWASYQPWLWLSKRWSPAYTNSSTEPPTE